MDQTSTIVAEEAGLFDGVDSFSRMMENMRIGFHMQPIEEQGFRAHVRRRHTRNAVLAEMDIVPSFGHRGKNEMSRDSDEYTCVSLVLSGQQRFRFDDAEISSASGSIVIWNSQRPMIFNCPEMTEMRTLMLSNRHFSAIDGWDRIGGHNMHLPAPSTQLLSAHLKHLHAHAYQYGDQQWQRILNSTAELLIGAFDAQSGPSTWAERSVLQDIQDHIVREFMDEDLSLDSVAQKFGLSRRTVQAAFSRRGTSFSKFLLETRLDMATDLLRFGTADGGSITAIAYQLGFSDAAHFCRAFKKKHGVSPGRFRSSEGGSQRRGISARRSAPFPASAKRERGSVSNSVA